MASTSLDSLQRIMSSIPRRSMYAVLPLTAGTVIIILQWRQRKASKSKPKPKDAALSKDTEPKALKSAQKSSKKTLPSPPTIYEDSTAQDPAITAAAAAASPAPPSYRDHIAAKLGRGNKDSSRQPLKNSQPKSSTKQSTADLKSPSAANVMDRPHPKRSRFSDEPTASPSPVHAPTPTIVEPASPASHLPGMGRPNSVYELQATSKPSSDLLVHSDAENDRVLEADDEGTPGSPSWLARVQSWERKHGRRGLKSGSQEKLGAEAGAGHEQQSPLAEKGKTFLRKLKGGKAKVEGVSP